MPLPAPTRAPHRRRPALAAATLACILAAACLAPALAHALDVRVARPHEREGFVWTDVLLSNVFDERVREGLERGVPATLAIRAELWRKRNGWFDRMERTFEGSFRIRHEVWRRAFRLERAGTEPAYYGTLDSLRTALQRPVAIPITRVQNIRAGADYYVVVTVILRPLSVEDVEEVEGWLSGETERGGSGGVGLITALPRALFDAVKNLAGFGDQRARAVSSDFALDDLLTRRPALP